MSGSDVDRICERVRMDLPRLADETLPGWRRRLAVRHLEGCEACAAELERQRSVTEGLHGLGVTASTSAPPPPDDLLDQILADVEDPGVRARVARPVRGAVSGARPELSLTAVALAALLIYLVWRLVRRSDR